MKLIFVLLYATHALCLRIDNKTPKNPTRWQTCSSCDAHHPKNSKQLLLELELFRDRVEFQFENMITHLSSKILNIENNVDVSAKQSLDKVKESILELATSIKSKIKQRLDDFRDIVKENYKQINKNLAIKNISERINKLGIESKEFTSNGINSLEILQLNLAKDYKNDVSLDNGNKKITIEDAEQFIFKNIPPKNIVTMLKTFKLDMQTEGDKLISKFETLKTNESSV